MSYGNAHRVSRKNRSAQKQELVWLPPVGYEPVAAQPKAAVIQRMLITFVGIFRILY